MLNPKLSSIGESNKTSSMEPWLAFLELKMPGAPLSDALFIVANNEDVTYNGQLYTAFNFSIELIDEQAQGQLSTVVIMVSNVNRVVESLLAKYHGGIGATAKLFWVSHADLTAEPEFETTYEIAGASADPNVVQFTLGTANPMRRLYPLHRYMASHCWKTFNTPAMQAAADPRGTACNYFGPLTSCSKRLDGDNGCRAHANVLNYGGVPGVDAAGFRRASP